MRKDGQVPGDLGFVDRMKGAHERNMQRREGVHTRTVSWKAEDGALPAGRHW